MPDFSDYIRALRSATTLNHLIPVVAQADDSVWITRRGDLLLNLKIRGVYSSLMTDDELKHATEAYEHARARFDEDFILYEYLHKRELDGIPMRGGYGHEAIDLAVQGRADFLKQKGDALYSIENGEIRIDEEGRICLNGNAPEPRRGKESGAGKKKKDFCTDKLPEGLRLYFERLDPEARAQMEADYWAIREHRKKLLRDAVAAARDQGQAIEDEWLAAIGYEDGERRGRRKGGREGSIVKLAVSGFPELSVQINGAANSVQNGNGPVYRNESGSVQISASLLDTEVSESFR